jgi:hypothetical protein
MPVGPQPAAAGLRRAVEERGLNQRMVVEPLDVAGGLHRGTGVRVDGGRTMCRERTTERLAERVGAVQAGDTAAARGVALEHVDGLRLEHPAEPVRVRDALARGDGHAGRGTLTNLPQTLEVVGGDALLEPADVLLREALRHPQRVGGRPRAVAVDHQFRVRADRVGAASSPGSSGSSRPAPPTRAFLSTKMREHFRFQRGSESAA